MKSERIGVLMGGLSAERDVSIKSGEAVFNALKERGYDVVRVFVDRDIDRLLRQAPIDVAFIALHGTYGEDGCIQGLLEVMGIPYTGPGVAESALCMDKLKAKQLFQILSVPTPPYYSVTRDGLDALESIHDSFGFPAFVKPRRQGSSIGIGMARDLNQLIQCCQEAFRFDDTALVERFVAGQEIAIGVLDGHALGAIEIVPKSGIYDYKSKYQSGQSQYFFPARLDPARYRGVMNIAEQAVHAVDAMGAVRVDLIATQGQNEYVLEVNTLPGMTPTSLLPKIAKGAGYDFGDLCEAILQRASLGVHCDIAKGEPPREELIVERLQDPIHPLR